VITFFSGCRWGPEGFAVIRCGERKGCALRSSLGSGALCYQASLTAGDDFPQTTSHPSKGVFRRSVVITRPKNGVSALRSAGACWARKYQTAWFGCTKLVGGAMGANAGRDRTVLKVDVDEAYVGASPEEGVRGPAKRKARL